MTATPFPQLDQFLRQLGTAIEQLVHEALAPYHPPTG